MICRYCHAPIEEYIKWDFQNERQIKRFECPACGPVELQDAEHV